MSNIEHYLPAQQCDVSPIPFECSGATQMEDFQVRAVDVATLILVAVAGSDAETLVAAVKDPARGKARVPFFCCRPSLLGLDLCLRLDSQKLQS